jgi:hypothetical protein
MAMEFNGGQYINCGNGPRILGSNPRTIITRAVWNGTNAHVIGWGSDGTNQRCALLFWGGKLYAWSYSGGGLPGSGAIPVGSSFSAALVYDGSLLSLWINGALDVQDYRNWNTGSAVACEIGRTAGAASYHYGGTLDDIRIYNRALSAAEIQTIHASNGHDGIVQGLVGRWLLNELSPGTAATAAGSIIDHSGRGNHGTPYGGPIYRGSELSFGRRYL